MNITTKNRNDLKLTLTSLIIMISIYLIYLRDDRSVLTPHLVRFQRVQKILGRTSQGYIYTLVYNLQCGG